MFVGNPNQYLVGDKRGLKAFIEENNGTAPCFKSHNGVPSQTTTKIRYIPFDFDADKLENALNDVLSLRDWAKERRLQVLTTFTGGRGFHCYFVFRPEVARNSDSLKRVYRAIQSVAISGAKLRTADRRIVGDTRRLMRIPNTLHQKTQRYCIEVAEVDLEGADIEHVLDLSKAPSKKVLNPRPHETFRECLRRLEIRGSSASSLPTETQSTIPYKTTSKGLFVQKLRDLIPRRCIHNALMFHNPPHMIRWEALTTMINLGFGVKFVREFFDELADKAGWVDRGNRNVMYQQIYFGFRHGRDHYKPHSCKTIRNAGLCVGKVCERFKYEFPEDVK